MDIERTPRIDLSTAGIAVAYAFEMTAGTRPTSTYTHIAGISSIPEMNESPEMIDTTTLDELVEHVGVPGLKGLPSATGFTANYTEKLDQQWSDLMKKYEQAEAAGLRMWATVVIPGVTKAFYFPVKPTYLGVPAADVGNVLSITLYLTKVGEVKQAEKPTSIVAWSDDD